MLYLWHMKTVLITGATSGFGQETARLLAHAGHHLILTGRRQERLEKLASSLKTEIYTSVTDVTDQVAVQALFRDLPQPFHDIDVLVNNAGLALGLEPAQEADLENWDQMVDTNIKGLLYVTHAALQNGLAERGSGLIINIGSVAGTVPYRGGNVYGATKAFVRQFSRNLRTDLAGTGIKVTNIEPGAAETEFSTVRFKDEQKAKEYYAGWQPLQPEDIANTIAWIINQPAHVNVDSIEIMPLAQSYGGIVIDKKGEA